MKIAFVNLGSLNYILASTCILNRIRKYNYNFNIDFVFDGKEYLYLNKYNSIVNNTLCFSDFINKRYEYDLIINLFPSIPQACIDKYFSDINNKMGFQFDENCDIFDGILRGEKDNYSINLFQIYYKIMGWVWKGEGYDLSYFPRSKSKKKNVGISVSNSNLRNFILDRLKLDTNKVSYVPYKKNIFKRMDEINRCDKIITDDLIVLNLSLYLRKYVYFLETFPICYDLEMFNNGEIIKVSLDTI